MDVKFTRNFAIIAHIDHGKSTLADRMLELTNSVNERKMKEQFLDDLVVERNRGITVKSRTVCIKYKYKDGNIYKLNLVDTPGHVDFSYEVSRSLKACEGAILVVDASQGVQAQSIANTYKAAELNLEIIPVINKIDLPSADIDKTKREIEELIGIDANSAILTSAKKKIGIDSLLDAIIERIPQPKGDIKAPPKALIIDSWYDAYRGVIVLVRVFDGILKTEDKIFFMSTQKTYEIDSIGIFDPFPSIVNGLSAGDIGFISAGVKHPKDVKIGDTIGNVDNPINMPLKGFKIIKPIVYCGFYLVDPEALEVLKNALEKLSLNDPSFTFEAETSSSLGVGYRCGFLGILHMEIIQERLEKEFGINLITTAPTVKYRVHKKDSTILEVDNPSLWPNPSEILKVEEPFVYATIIIPDEFVGNVIQLMQSKRGKQKNIKYTQENRVVLEYNLPLAEMILDFYDKLMSTTKGFASFDYEHIGYYESDLVKLDIMINKNTIDALSYIVDRAQAYYKARELVERIQKVIPRQLFEVSIQAAIGKKIIARKNVKAYRKNVTAKCYGGDITRKKKLLEKQKEGKKRMKHVGKVEIPQEAFLSILKI
ncbi:MAG: translation elongation factor 4 [Deferribacterota bacterium]|nr:translation elongation factor 4 [Deferribacterota bacterium]